MTIWSDYAILDREVAWGKPLGWNPPAAGFPIHSAVAPRYVASPFRVASTGLVQTLQAAQVAAEVVSVLKTCSNSGLPRPGITEPSFC